MEQKTKHREWIKTATIIFLSVLLILLIGSTLMLSLGIIGYYLARIYEELKNRPRYLISEIISSRNDGKSGNRSVP